MYDLSLYLLAMQSNGIAFCNAAAAQQHSSSSSNNNNSSIHTPPLSSVSSMS
jgi:hypothetical protein